MTLDDLIDDRNKSTDSSDDNQDNETKTTHEVVSRLAEQSDADVDYNFLDNQEKCDYSKDRKVCPRCLTISEKVNERPYSGYECTNDNCGIVQFNMDWYEYNQIKWDDEFLSSIDWVAVMEELNDNSN